MFQSTHPRGVRRELSQDDSRRRKFQSTHPRGVRRDTPHSGRSDLVFQSTHPRGVRLAIDQNLQRPSEGFNPRTREGCDITLSGQSLHHLMFQSTHPRGVRHEGFHSDFNHLLFQSTHPRGVRQAVTCVGSVSESGFNPRTREGCD